MQSTLDKIIDWRIYAMSLAAAVALLSSNAIAGTWGNENWSEMYWGDNPVSEPLVPPTIESVVVDGTNLIITIADYIPGQDGWSGITGYSVTCGTAATINSESQRVRVEGLDAETEYECVVLASNAQGTSPQTIQFATTDAELLQGLSINILYLAACASTNPPAGCPAQSNP